MNPYREPIFHDRQEVIVAGPITTTSLTFVDVPGAEIITVDLSQLAIYQFWVNLSIQQSNNNTAIHFRAVINGVPQTERSVEFGPSSSNNPQQATLVGQRDGVIASTTIKLQWHVTGGTGQINDLTMLVDGIPENRIIT